MLKGTQASGSTRRRGTERIAWRLPWRQGGGMRNRTSRAKRGLLVHVKQDICGRRAQLVWT